MYGGFERQRQSIRAGPSVRCQVRGPGPQSVEQVAEIYQKLDLGDFEAMRPELESLLQQRKGYRPNRHAELEPELQAQIRQRWASYYETYDYSNGSLA
jgi:omega-hydroxy-beta-dihydromenaquinone-9 sulfotransferase